VVHPVQLPDVQDAGPEYGWLRTALFFGFYAVLILGALLYLVWKLPRRNDD